MAEFDKRYRQPGTHLADRGRGERNPDFSEWQLRLHPKVLQENAARQGQRHTRSADSFEFNSDVLICCPEDHRCIHDCVREKLLCRECLIPICSDCSIALQQNQIAPMSLINDNFHGYLESWLYTNDVTWMEKTVATPY